MPRFNVGDKVRVNIPSGDTLANRAYQGLTGTVENALQTSCKVIFDTLPASGGFHGHWQYRNLEAVDSRYDTIRRIDRALDEYGADFGRSGLHDLRLLHHVQGLVDEPQVKPETTEADLFEALVVAEVNLDDDQRWAAAAYEHEADKVREVIEATGLVRDNPEEYILHFGVVGYLTLPEPDRVNLVEALRRLGGYSYLHQDGDRFGEWGEAGLLDGEDATRVADRAGHFMIQAPGYIHPLYQVWAAVRKSLPAMVFLTPEQIAETGGPTPDHPFVTTTVEDWAEHVEIF